MTRGLLFWILMILWLILGLYLNREAIGAGSYGIAGGNLLLFILFALLGWQVFGSPIQGGNSPRQP